MIPYKCIDCNKTILIQYGGICSECKKQRDRKSR